MVNEAWTYVQKYAFLVWKHWSPFSTTTWRAESLEASRLLEYILLGSSIKETPRTCLVGGANLHVL